MKRSFFQAAVLSTLLHGGTTWMLTKRLEKKLDGNYTRMLRAILNKSWRQLPTRHQLYGHQPPIAKTIHARRTRHAGHCWRIKDELIRDVVLWTPAYGQAKQDDQLEHTYSSYVRIRDVSLKTCQSRWTIGRSSERVRGICASGTTWWWWWWWRFPTFLTCILRKMIFSNCYQNLNYVSHLMQWFPIGKKESF